MDRIPNKEDASMKSTQALLLTIKDTGLPILITAHSVESVTKDPASDGSLITLISGRVRVVKETPEMVMMKLVYCSDSANKA